MDSEPKSRWGWWIAARAPNVILYAWPGFVSANLPIDENDEADYFMGLEYMQSCLFQ
jgi:hypothetical protein